MGESVTVRGWTKALMAVCRMGAVVLARRHELVSCAMRHPVGSGGVEACACVCATVVVAWGGRGVGGIWRGGYCGAPRPHPLGVTLCAWRSFWSACIPADDRCSPSPHSGCISCPAFSVLVSLCPVSADVVKTRLMTQIASPATGGKLRYRGVAHAAVTIAREEGVGAFARGLVPRVAAKTVQSAVFFSVYELVRQAVAEALQVDMSGVAKRGGH